jgi:hypothetical protein
MGKNESGTSQSERRTMSKQKTTKDMKAYAVSSGNIFRAVMAKSHIGAAKKAVKAHYHDPAEDTIEPGKIFCVHREGDSGDLETYFETDRVMSAAGFKITENNEA